MSRRALSLTVVSVAVLAPAATAQAQLRKANNVRSPTSNITCGVVKRSGPKSGIWCFARYLPASVGTDGYIGLRRRGTSYTGEAKSFHGYATKRETLDYGDTWEPRRGAQGISCRMLAAALTCTNRDGRGFRLSKEAVTRF
ncbi:hypothetical protein ACVU7I_11610 [Patulibacter sp. S7RM1-6]